MNRLNKEDIIEFFNDETDVKKYRAKVIGKHRPLKKMMRLMGEING